MKLSSLQPLLDQYFESRPWYTRIFSSPPHIKALQEFINQQKRTFPESDPDLLYSEFINYATNHRLNLDLNDAFFQSSKADSQLFRLWKISDEIQKSIKPIELPELVLVPLKLKDFSVVNSELTPPQHFVAPQAHVLEATEQQSQGVLLDLRQDYRSLAGLVTERQSISFPNLIASLAPQVAPLPPNSFTLLNPILLAPNAYNDRICIALGTAILKYSNLQKVYALSIQRFSASIEYNHFLKVLGLGAFAFLKETPDTSSFVEAFFTAHGEFLLMALKTLARLQEFSRTNCKTDFNFAQTVTRQSEIMLQEVTAELDQAAQEEAQACLGLLTEFLTGGNPEITRVVLINEVICSLQNRPFESGTHHWPTLVSDLNQLNAEFQQNRTAPAAAAVSGAPRP